MSETILSIENLRIHFKTFAGEVQAIRGVNLNLQKGETLALVGESGSGKSVTAKSVMQLLSNNAMVKEGSILFKGENLLEKSEREMQSIRGKEIAMIFQDPMTSLNPTMKIGRQIAEVIIKHEKASKEEAYKRAEELLELVGIPNPKERMKQYPHQFSGGQRQRIVIAIALACNPDILIADEPTTALDVTIQAQILELLKELQCKFQMAIIFITHDLGVVANVADRVAVMYAGKVVEVGTSDEVFYNPQHPYTWGLLRSMPTLHTGDILYAIPGSPPDLLDPPKGDAFALRSDVALEIDRIKEPPMFQVSKTHFAATWLLDPRAPKVEVPEEILRRRKIFLEKEVRLMTSTNDKKKLVEVKHLKQYFGTKKNVVKAIDDISFDIYEGETFGLVGESGSGKSTTGRALLRLYQPTDGEILFEGKDIATLTKGKELLEFRKEAQMIFQDPYASLDSRMKVRDIIAEGIDIHHLASTKEERNQMVDELLETVGLNREHANRYPHEFSGGQRQRIGIARALALNPKFIVCDEAISALDVSIQAQIVNLLKKLQKEKGLTYLFIAHDLSMVKYISDRIAVMYHGRIVEMGSAECVYTNPQHAYTKSLLSAIPLPDPREEKNRKRIVYKGEDFDENATLQEVEPGHFVLR